MTITYSVPKRSEMSIENTWDLTPLCANNTSFSEAFSAAESKIDILASYRGKISQSAADLYAYLKEKDAQLTGSTATPSSIRIRIQQIQPPRP